LPAWPGWPHHKRWSIWRFYQEKCIHTHELMKANCEKVQI
jgi:hypothetical protein